MAEMDVDIVDVDRKMWSGRATFIFTRTTVGEIGIMPRHIPLVAQLVEDAMVRVEREGQEDLRIATHGGYLTVTEDGGVIILAESAEFASEIDEATARHDAQSGDPRIAARGRARLRALGVLE
ncbi:MAG: ATP synthase F1 subunit epsilon [Mycobacterium sp.]|uniref:ATP synthase F1 subunit epsilon n=1 Tax=Mycobacterium sp. TaxID=1785 RepID=UPI002626789A|nr:ATP synthase F1 subunit epsilon [Mycobacterium sp.]MDI3315546.1 ATP synthase F1 subunit epsilon [Mycobacterium sp.]